MITPQVTNPNNTQTTRQPVQTIKCVVWDLDDTLWYGTLLEDSNVVQRDDVSDVIRVLDSRGIQNSIASRNDRTTALAKLEQFGLLEYFLYPQINWNSKATSIIAIAKELNIGLDSVAFVDDQPFEREEVSYSIPGLLCIDAKEIDRMLEIPAMNPRFITEDSRKRRMMYVSEMARDQAEKEFIGTSEEFLASLDMRLTISSAREEDLERAEELTLRTHQLNTTGYTYSYEELNKFRTSKHHKLLIAGLDDKYGSYGKIGLVLLECLEEVWTIKLLLMSCRVISRGIGTIMINHAMSLAKAAGARLQAEFVGNDRNRMMYITYKFAGFNDVKKKERVIILQNDLTHIQPFPEYVRVRIDE